MKTIVSLKYFVNDCSFIKKSNCLLLTTGEIKSSAKQELNKSFSYKKLVLDKVFYQQKIT